MSSVSGAESPANDEGSEEGRGSKRRREGSEDLANEPPSFKKQDSREDMAAEVTSDQEVEHSVFKGERDELNDYDRWNGVHPDDSVTSTGEEDPSLIFVPPDKVGHIIGSKGMVIQELQKLSVCRIVLNQDFPPGVDRTMHFEGQPDQIAHAQELVRRILREGPTAIHPVHSNLSQHPENTSQEISCAQSRVGRVIGTGGSTIREIQNRSGARLVVNQDFPEGVDRKVIVSGAPHAVAMGVFLVNYVIQNGPLLPPATSTQEDVLLMSPMLPLGSSGNFTQTIDVEKHMVGKLIGKGGETINLMQKKSGARIQIEQNTHPCKVVMTGAPQVL